MTDIKELAALALKVRDAQKAYFKNRKPSDLQTSKQLEAELDKSIAEILKPVPDNQTSLFK